MPFELQLPQALAINHPLFSLPMPSTWSLEFSRDLVSYALKDEKGRKMMAFSSYQKATVPPTNINFTQFSSDCSMSELEDYLWDLPEFFQSLIKVLPANNFVKLNTLPLAPKQPYIGQGPLIENMKLWACALPETKDELKPQVLLLTGLPGSGKSAACLAHLKRETGIYRKFHQLWFSAETYETLLSAYAHFIQSHMPEQYLSENLQETDIIQKMQKWFMDNPDWVAVYDNIQSFNGRLLSAMPKCGRGKVLLNSCHLPPPAWEETLDFSKIALEKMSLEDASRLFTVLLEDKKNPKPKETIEAIDIDYLIDSAGTLPLALVKHAALIARFDIPLKNYLEVYQQWLGYYLELPLVQEGNALQLAEKSKDQEGSAVPPGFVLNASIQQRIYKFLRHYFENQPYDDTYVHDLLRFCAYLHPKDISFALLEAWERYTYPMAPASLNLVLENLNAAHLIEWNSHAQTLSVPPMLQAVVRHGLSTEEEHKELAKLYHILRQVFSRVKDFSAKDCLLQHTKMLKLHNLTQYYEQLDKMVEKTRQPQPARRLFLVFLDIDNVILDTKRFLAQQAGNKPEGAPISRYFTFLLKAMYDKNNIPHAMRDYTSKKVIATMMAHADREAIDNIYAMIDYIEGPGDLDVRFVVSSGWRVRRQLSSLKEMFAYFEEIADKLLSATPDCLPGFDPDDMEHQCHRGAQILCWLEDRINNEDDVDAFVVLDDQDLELSGPFPISWIPCPDLFNKAALEKVKQAFSSGELFQEAEAIFSNLRNQAVWTPCPTSYVASLNFFPSYTPPNEENEEAQISPFEYDEGPDSEDGPSP